MSDAPTRGELIEQRIDKDVAGQVPVSIQSGGLDLQNMVQVMEMSKLMAISQQAVPNHLRNNPGMCLAVCLTAVEWKMSPFAVANKTYVTNDRLNYESQLVHAVIEARAPLKERLKVRYEGEGEDRVCIVSGTFRGEYEAREHRSPPLRQCRPGKNQYGQTKGSPLWDKKPDVQMFYDTSRDFCRIYCPDVLLGIYTPDEVEQYGIGEDARDVTAGNGLHERLAASRGSQEASEGFRDGAVDAALGGQQEATGEAAGEKPPAAAKKRGRPSKAKETATEPVATEGAQEPSPSVVEAQDQAAGDVKPLGVEPEIIPPTKPAAPGAPRTPEAYHDWVSGWTQAVGEVETIEKQWASERKMRNDIGMVSEETALAREVVDARIAEIKAGG